MKWGFWAYLTFLVAAIVVASPSAGVTYAWYADYLDVPKNEVAAGSWGPSVPEACVTAFGEGWHYNLIEGSGDGEPLEGTNKDDLIFGYGGSDTIEGGNGKDCIVGGDGIDHIDGGNGKDVLIGGAGDDQLDGRNGKDGLFGGTGNDLLLGGNAPDILDGGPGVADECVGGHGSDKSVGCETRIFAPDDALNNQTSNSAIEGATVAVDPTDLSSGSSENASQSTGDALAVDSASDEASVAVTSPEPTSSPTPADEGTPALMTSEELP